MPEFEDNKTNPDLHKNAHNYQPSRGKPQESGQEASSAPSSNMRGRWKRSARGGAPKFTAKEETSSARLTPVSESIAAREEAFSAAEDYDVEPEHEHEHELRHSRHEPVEEREERAPRAHAPRKPWEDRKEPRKEEKVFKPTSRKDVFIPKTKQDSERYRTRSGSSSHKKPSLWRKILAFFGLAAPIKKHSSERKPYTRHSDSSRRPRTSSHKKPYQQRRHSGPSRHRSGPSHKNDQ